MDLKISNNLFLGLHELRHLKKSLKQDGYERLFKQMVSSYGIVRPYQDNQFTNLQVIDSGLGKLTVRSGIAIDKDLNAIELVTDQSDAITIPNDGVERDVIIGFRESIVEQGTVNIQADGTIVGVDTQFLNRLRGLPNFASKITFPLSENNTEEYIVQAVQSNTLGSLNVAGSQLVAESNQVYTVVGTFTPGISVPTSEKNPFIGDGSKIELRLSGSARETDREFILATVSRTGGIVSVQDKRLENVFNFLTQDLDATNTIEFDSKNIACTEVKFSATGGAVDQSIAKVEWGIRSDAWSINPQTRKLRIFDGKGGSWNDFSQFVNGDFIGQYVAFENGQSSRILGSELLEGDIVFDLEYQSNYISTGTIVVGPAGLVELRIKHKTKDFSYSKIAPGFAGYAKIELPKGEYNVKYRAISDKAVSGFENIKSNQYLTEQSFNSNGFLIAGSEVTEQSTNGDIKIGESTNALFKLLNNIVFPGVIWDYGGSLNNLPSGWVLCDGQEINEPTSIFHGQTAPDLGGRVTVGHKLADNDYNTLKETGGEKMKTLTEAQMPQHTHPVTDPGHSHADTKYESYGRKGTDSGSFEFLAQQVSETGSSTTGISMGNAGGGEPFDNRQPYMVMYKIMKL